MKKYIVPSINIIDIENEDIIAATGGTREDGNNASTDIDNAIDHGNGGDLSNSFRSTLWN